MIRNCSQADKSAKTSGAETLMEEIRSLIRGI